MSVRRFIAAFIQLVFLAVPDATEAYRSLSLGSLNSSTVSQSHAQYCVREGFSTKHDQKGLEKPF